VDVKGVRGFDIAVSPLRFCGALRARGHVDVRGVAGRVRVDADGGGLDSPFPPVTFTRLQRIVVVGWLRI
jgi:hypothetical protein